MESTSAEKSTSESSSAEEGLSWDTPLEYEPMIEETSDEIESAQKKSCCDQNRGNHNHEPSQDSYFPPRKSPETNGSSQAKNPCQERSAEDEKRPRSWRMLRRPVSPAAAELLSSSHGRFWHEGHFP